MERKPEKYKCTAKASVTCLRDTIPTALGMGVYLVSEDRRNISRFIGRIS